MVLLLLGRTMAHQMLDEYKHLAFLMFENSTNPYSKWAIDSAHGTFNGWCYNTDWYFLGDKLKQLGITEVIIYGEDCEYAQMYLPKTLFGPMFYYELLFPTLYKIKTYHVKRRAQLFRQHYLSGSYRPM